MATAPIIIDSVDRENHVVRCSYFVYRRLLPNTDINGQLTTVYREYIICYPQTPTQPLFQTADIIETFFTQQDDPMDADVSVCTLTLPIEAFGNGSLNPGEVYRIKVKRQPKAIFATDQGIDTKLIPKLVYSEMESQAFREWQEMNERIAVRILEGSPQLRLGSKDDEARGFTRNEEEGLIQ